MTDDRDIENFQYILRRVLDRDCVIERVTVSSELDKYKCILVHSPDGSFIFGEKDLEGGYLINET